MPLIKIQPFHIDTSQTYTFGGVGLAGTTSPLLLNGAAGTAGQVLTSSGPGATPVWGAGASAIVNFAAVNFGIAPGGNYASVVVTNSNATNSRLIVPYRIAVAPSSDHNVVEHMFVDLRLSVSDIVDGVSFTINAFSDLRLTGEFLVGWQII